MQQPDGCFVSLCWPCDGPGIGSVACDSDKDTWKRLDEWIEIQQLSRFFFNYLMLHLKSYMTAVFVSADNANDQKTN